MHVLATAKARKVETQSTPQGQCPSPDRPGRGSTLRLAQEGHLSQGQGLPTEGPKRSSARGCRDSTQDPKADYAIPSSNAEFHELGTAYLDAVDAGRVTTNLVRRLERLGYEVSIAQRAVEGASIPATLQTP